MTAAPDPRFDGPDPKDAPSLLSDAINHFTHLIRGEVELAKAEMSRKVSQAVLGLVLIVVAILLALTALNVLAGAVVAAIAATGLSAGWSALIVGGGLLIVALFLVLVGKDRLSIMPDRTIRNVERDVNTIKEASNV